MYELADNQGWGRQGAYVFFKRLAYRYERHSLIITSNQPIEDRDELFSYTTMSDLSIGGLVNHAHIIQLTGESYRRKTAIHRWQQVKIIDGLNLADKCN
ncbi:MAG: DNA replication protein DnaC [Paraglaciecola sp.]|jgi:DNA replication protein DnaC